MSSKSPAPINEARPLGKTHARQIKPSEEDRIAKGRHLAAAYLMARDGMDMDTAAEIVGSMDVEDVNALIDESNTAVIARYGRDYPAGAAAGTAGAPALKDGATPIEGAALVEPDEGPMPNYTEVPALAERDEFPGLVISVAANAKLKNSAEKAYKEGKGIILQILTDAGAPRVECLGWKMSVYEGESKQLDEHLLLEAGVSADTIKRCWKSKKYTDVRMTVVKKEV